MQREKISRARGCPHAHTHTHLPTDGRSNGGMAWHEDDEMTMKIRRAWLAPDPGSCHGSVRYTQPPSSAQQRQLTDPGSLTHLPSPYETSAALTRTGRVQSYLTQVLLQDPREMFQGLLGAVAADLPPISTVLCTGTAELR